jgi:hypothetical protein
MSARADSGSGATTDLAPSKSLNRTQNYSVTRHSRENTPVITRTSDNGCTVRLAESDSESHGESKHAAPSSTRIPLPASSLPVLEVERFIEETARMRRAA